jgi:hypothetical protein
MKIEVLSEDRSSAIMIENLIRRIIKISAPDCPIHVRPHRGRGDFPLNLSMRPEPNTASLLDLLPAKLRAYDKIYAGTDLILIVLMDADYHSPELLSDQLKTLCKAYATGVQTVIGLCVEETEAWLLGDAEAVMQAYPDADPTLLSEYIQDSICGTWEVLCRAILKDQAERVIRVGYPAIGQYKNEWASRISDYMNPDLNQSPSFRKFRAALLAAARK